MKKKTLKKIASLLVSAAILAGLTACGNSASTDSSNTSAKSDTEENSVSSELKELNIGVGGTDESFTMELANLAYNNGYLEDELEAVGYTVKIHAFQGAGPEINEGLASKALNAAVYGDFPAFMSKSNGIDTKIVATVNKKQQYGVLALGNIKSAKDLEGKKVIVPVGTVAQHYWEGYANEYGIDTSSVEMINVADATSLLSTGEADAYAMTLPMLKYFESIGLGKVLEDSQAYTEGYTSYVFTVAFDVLSESPEVGVAINKALIKAYNDAVANPQALYDAVASPQIGSDCYAAQYAFDPTLSFLSPEFTQESLIYYENLNKWLIDHSLIASPVALDSFIGKEYYQQAADEINK